MPPTRTRSKKVAKRKEFLQQPTPPFQDGSSDEFNGVESDDPMEKDENELELERMVFGDEAGFHADLKSHKTYSGVIDIDNGENTVGNREEANGDDRVLEDVTDAELFFLDAGPSTVRNADLIRAPTSEEEDITLHGDSVPAWVDSDDERLVVSLASNPRLRKLRKTEAEDLVNGKEYTKRLRQQFERLYPVPEWANPSASKLRPKKKPHRGPNASSHSADASADEMSVDSDSLSVQPLAKLLQSTSMLSSPSTTHKKLRAEALDIQRLKDVGSAQSSTISCLTFHPSHPLLLSSGASSTLTLHHISPSTIPPHPLLTTLHLNHTPLHTSTIDPSGARIFFSGRRRYFHIWDLNSGTVQKVTRVCGHQDSQRTMERFKLSPCGRWMGLVGSARKGGGVINILDARSTQWIAECRVNGGNGVGEFEWWGDGEGMLIVGKGGEAVEYNLSERRVIAKWTDDGGFGITVVGLGGKGQGCTVLGGDRWCAIGSQSGIVNVYDRRTWKNGEIPARPQPTRVLSQLTTPTSFLAFSPDGQILCMGSRWKRDALRLVHLPSCTVFRNWPTSGTPLGRVSAVAWGRGGEWLAVGNEQGKIRLWEIGS